MTDSITSLPAAVAALGALPMPAGSPAQALSDERLAEIEARLAKLSEHGLPGGTWTTSPCDGKSVVPPETAHVVEDVLRTSGALLRSSVGVFGEAAHAEFAAHAREDVPALLAEVQRLRAELAKYVGSEPTIAEEMAYLSRCLHAVHDVCDDAEKQATRWEHLLPVPEWVERVRAAADGPDPRRSTVTEYGIRFSDSSVLSEGNPKSRQDQKRRLADYLPECPQARLVQRTVHYGEWTEADR